MLQGFLMLVVSLPITVVFSSPARPLGALDVIGALVFAAGFLFETVGDRQLAAHVSDPANKGQLMTRGLWSTTRHPNYFGEATLWWGIGLIALRSANGWAALIGPAVITFLLVFVSGVPLLEKKYAGRPDWEAYKAQDADVLPLVPEEGPARPGRRSEMRRSLFIFRRDLRLKDNTGLMRALRDSGEVIPAFIFDPRQTGRHPYKSDNALQFLAASLAGLDRELRARGSHLSLFQGRAEKVVSALIRSEGLDAVYVNRDYTPFSRRRDAAIEDACREKNVAFVVARRLPPQRAGGRRQSRRDALHGVHAVLPRRPRPRRAPAAGERLRPTIMSGRSTPKRGRRSTPGSCRGGTTGSSGQAAGPKPFVSWPGWAASRTTRRRGTFPPSTERPGSPRTPSSARSPSGNSTRP